MIVSEGVTSTFGKLFTYNYPATVMAIEPRVAYSTGGMTLSVLANGMADQTQTWCKFGRHNVYVMAKSVSTSNVECVCASVSRKRRHNRDHRLSNVPVFCAVRCCAYFPRLAISRRANHGGRGAHGH